MEIPPDRLESAVVSRLMWRLLPFLFLLYIVAYLDRINVSFAVLQMRGQLGLSDRAYGRAAGMFFAGYFFFQLPSNLVLEKFGVRRWISGLMITWGVISCLMIFIRGPISFYAMRFLLGAAEAGFFPGMILYMKRWFPANARARAVAWFMTANPLAGIVGSPVSGALLGLSGKGLSGWQWMFLMEGIPAILLGAAVFWALSDNPREASWLKGEEREWLLARLALEQQADSTLNKDNLWAVLASPRIWMLSIVYFGVSTTMYGVTLWLPSVIRSLSGLSYLLTGLVSSLPFLVTAIAMVVVGMLSDRSGERRWHTAMPAFVGAVALVAAGYGAFYGPGGSMHRTWDGLRGVDGRTFLGDGDFTDGWPFGSCRNRRDQLSRESGRIFRSRYYRILSQGERRLSWRAAGDRGDTCSQRRRRLDRGSPA